METQELYLLLGAIVKRARQRLLGLVVLLSITSGIGYYLTDGIMSRLFSMVGRVIFISPAEAFVTKLKIAVTAGVLIALPALLYMLIGAIGSATRILNRRTHLLFTVASFALFVCGGAFCYFAALPAGVQFLLGFSTLEMQPLLSAGRFVSFVLLCLLVFGIMFELPLIILLLASMGVLNADTLRKKRRHAILLMFIVAGFLSPSPDIISQILLAVPLMVLYEAGILLTRFCAKPAEQLPQMPSDQQQLFM